MKNAQSLARWLAEAVPAAGLTVLLAIALGGPQIQLALAFFTGTMPTPEQASAVAVLALWTLFVSVLGWCIWSALRALGTAWMEESRRRHQEQIRQLLIGSAGFGIAALALLHLGHPAVVTSPHDVTLALRLVGAKVSR